MSEITFDEFMAVDVRVGEITRTEPFPEARKPAYKLWINFGESIGEKKSSAQITVHYSLEELVGKRVMAVVNFPSRQIGPVTSHWVEGCFKTTNCRKNAFTVGFLEDYFL